MTTTRSAAAPAVRPVRPPRRHASAVDHGGSGRRGAARRAVGCPHDSADAERCAGDRAGGDVDRRAGGDRRNARAAFREDSWAEVYDASGAALFADIATAGAVQTVQRRAAAAAGARQRGRGRHQPSTAAAVHRSARRCVDAEAQFTLDRGGRDRFDDADENHADPRHERRAARGDRRLAAPRARRCASCCTAYGYEEMRVPMVEQHRAVQARSIGEFTDIVEKEMYTFADQRRRQPDAAARGDRRHRARGDLQRPAARRAAQAVVQRARCSATRSRRRAATASSTSSTSRPSASPGPDIDAELIALTARLWRALGITRVRLQINSLGTPESRQQLPRDAGRLLPAHHERARRGQPAPARGQPAAHPRQQESRDAGAGRGRAAAHGLSRRRVARAFRRAVRDARRRSASPTR